MARADASPALNAAERVQEQIHECIRGRRSFLVEAGAGSGKTYSLDQALRYIVKEHGSQLLRLGQRVACITYTNVAVDEIIERVDKHPVVAASTIHSFCWGAMSRFQPELRGILLEIKKWEERIEESGVGDGFQVQYDLGYPSVRDEVAFLHHNDVVDIFAALLQKAKFRSLLQSEYPILLIDEYQDTDKKVMQALLDYVIPSAEAPLIGMFGDHWQMIYDDTGMGEIESPHLSSLTKGANFRSAPVVIDCLNRLRPELKQEVHHRDIQGSVVVLHTNGWAGERETGPHSKGDLPADVARTCLGQVKDLLATTGWNMDPSRTKILMLTHRVLASEQGYSNLDRIFSRERLIGKEDGFIEFFCDVLEPACQAFENNRFAEMYEVLDDRGSAIRSLNDKQAWAKSMRSLCELRDTGSIGSVLDHLMHSRKPRLPHRLERRIEESTAEPVPEERASSVERLKAMRDVSYSEIKAVSAFINENTPFATQHGVKGAEFENVLAVLGRGWNKYNFGEFLKQLNDPQQVPRDKRARYERNRNLFYVICSRPKLRLCLLFTQELEANALETLKAVFGAENVRPLDIDA